MRKLLLNKYLNLLLAIVILILPVISVLGLPYNVYASTLILEPNGDSSVELTGCGQASNYMCVDEQPANDVDYVACPQYLTKTDYYNLQNHTVEVGIINYVKVYIRVQSGNTPYGGGAWAYLVVDGTSYELGATGASVTWTTYSFTSTNNPKTGVAWTWADIDSLIAGVKLSRGVYTAYNQCSQLYLEVDYNPNTAPTTDTAAVTDIGCGGATHFATLNGDITDDGGIAPTARGFAWSTTSNATTPTSGEVPPAKYTSNVTTYGTYSEGTFSSNVTSFAACTTYYVRAFAYNTSGWGWGDEVSFTSLCTPAITTVAAIYIASTSARLTAQVTSDGGQLADVRFSYGTITGNCTAGASCTLATCNSTSYTITTAWVENTYSTGNEPYVDISGLIQGTTYYFCAQVRNDYACACGGQLSFTTEASATTPTGLKGIPTAESISLIWAKGTGSTNTLIRSKLGDYPNATTDGDLVYFDEESSVSYTGLTPGTTYFIRAWGESGGVYSTTNATLMVTTLALAAGYDDQPNPTTPSTWFQAPDYTRMSAMPFYGIVNWGADSFQSDRSTVWFVFAMLCSVALAILIYRVSGGKIIVGVAVLIMGMGLSSFMGLMSMWLLLPAGVMMFGAIALGERL
jgi:hypothetical protein